MRKRKEMVAVMRARVGALVTPLPPSATTACEKGHPIWAGRRNIIIYLAKLFLIGRKLADQGTS